MFKTKTLFFSLLTALCFNTYVFSEATAPVFTATSVKANPRAVLHTTRGDITIELYTDKAPLTVANFIDYHSNVKPSLHAYLCDYTGSYETSEIQNAYNNFYENCIVNQIKMKG